MDSKLMSAALVCLVIGGAGGFYGGMQYQKNQAPVLGQGRGLGGARGGNFGGQPGGTGGQGRTAFGGGTMGEVLSKDDKSFTVKMRDGGSKVVFFASSTRVGAMTDGVIDDVKPGVNVMVMGAPNSDGSVTAQSVQIRPAGAPDFFGGRGNGGAAPATP
jgi:hypothetical protein